MKEEKEEDGLLNFFKIILKTGMRVDLGDEGRRFVHVNGKEIILTTENGYHGSLEYRKDHIQKVYDKPDTSNEYFNIKATGRLLWEKKKRTRFSEMTLVEISNMTTEDISEEFGYDVSEMSLVEIALRIRQEIGIGLA